GNPSWQCADPSWPCARSHCSFVQSISLRCSSCLSRTPTSAQLYHARFQRSSTCGPCSSRQSTSRCRVSRNVRPRRSGRRCALCRSEEHTSELQSRENLVCRLLLEKK